MNSVFPPEDDCYLVAALCRILLPLASQHLPSQKGMEITLSPCSMSEFEILQ